MRGGATLSGNSRETLQRSRKATIFRFVLKMTSSGPSADVLLFQLFLLITLWVTLSKKAAEHFYTSGEQIVFIVIYSL